MSPTPGELKYGASPARSSIGTACQPTRFFGRRDGPRTVEDVKLAVVACGNELAPAVRDAHGTDNADGLDGQRGGLWRGQRGRVSGEDGERRDGSKRGQHASGLSRESGPGRDGLKRFHARDSAVFVV